MLELLLAWGQVQSGYVSPALTHCCAGASGASVALGPVLHLITLAISSAYLFGPLGSISVLIHPSEATLQGSVTAQDVSRKRARGCHLFHPRGWSRGGLNKGPKTQSCEGKDNGCVVLWVPNLRQDFKSKILNLKTDFFFHHAMQLWEIMSAELQALSCGLCAV